MVKHKKRKKTKKREEEKRPLLPPKVKQWISGIVMCLLAVIVCLAFFDLAGIGGEALKTAFIFLIGKTIFLLPLIFLLGALGFFTSERKLLIALAMLILILGVSGILATLNGELAQGGWLGHLIAWPLIKGFGFWVSLIIFVALAIVGGLIFFQVLRKIPSEKKEVSIQERLGPEEEDDEETRPFLGRIFKPKFKVGQIEPEIKEKKDRRGLSLPFGAKSEPIKVSGYQPPSLDLLEMDRGVPSSGDIKVNSSIIQKTLQNFDISVEMAEVNVGPTVTQYTFKPAEGIKLSKITALNNDLSLALAAHPLRIEAPIPGRPLVGLEMPNKRRVTVRLKKLLDNRNFQSSSARLNLALGRDVSGLPIYADLARMPHLLVAGSTGSGKTIGLNTIILTLLYQYGPEHLRFILIDPKRVEFPVYNDLPHLLCPVIFGAQKAINVLKWLTEEMERRFDVLARGKARNIGSYNERVGKGEVMPYIVLVIDELADLMAARGREVEAGIVRLAQMARAVGIHLVVATQRPSVEVITGLIKANITSRIAFQVASQIDSRTVLDMAGAEKLLGQGDMLFISADIQKPKRIQSAYVSEKEVRKIVHYIKTKTPALESEEADIDIETSARPRTLDKAMEQTGEVRSFFSEQDPMYEEAKRTVFEAKKASASLLQRRLRLGYARAARLLDMLEEDGIIGPADGSKARTVYLAESEAIPGAIPEPPNQEQDNNSDNVEDSENDFKEVTF